MNPIPAVQKYEAEIISNALKEANKSVTKALKTRVGFHLDPWKGIMNDNKDAFCEKCRHPQRGERCLYAGSEWSTPCECECVFPVDSGNKNRPARHPLATAWDKWLTSKEGQQCTDGHGFLKSSTGDVYLENRLRRAFEAGVKAAKNLNVSNQEVKQ